MQFRKYFVQGVESQFGPRSAEIIIDADRHYRELSNDVAFARRSPNPVDRRLDFTAYFLALIKTLDSMGESYDRIRDVCLEITIQYVQPRNRVHAYVKRLLPKMIGTWIGQLMARKFHRRVSVNPNVDGFVAHIITDKEKTFGLGYGIDIIECGICKLFNKHGYGRYASILCEVDKITSGLAGLELIRNGTIANGAEKCDFRFRLVKKTSR